MKRSVLLVSFFALFFSACGFEGDYTEPVKINLPLENEYRPFDAPDFYSVGFSENGKYAYLVYYKTLGEAYLTVQNLISDETLESLSLSGEDFSSAWENGSEEISSALSKHGIVQTNLVAEFFPLGEDEVSIDVIEENGESIVRAENAKGEIKDITSVETDEDTLEVQAAFALFSPFEERTAVIILRYEDGRPTPVDLSIAGCKLNSGFESVESDYELPKAVDQRKLLQLDEEDEMRYFMDGGMVNFYSIGFSEDSYFAYLTYDDSDDFIGAVTIFNFSIVNLKTDEIVEEINVRKEEETIALKDLWEENYDEIKTALNAYGIVQDDFELEGDFEGNYGLIIPVDEEDPNGPAMRFEPVKSGSDEYGMGFYGEYSVVVWGEAGENKTICSEETTVAVVSIPGVIRSPFEDRVAVIVMPYNSWEATLTATPKVVGASLSKGF